MAPQNSESEEEKLFSCDLKHFITLTVHFHFKASDMIEYTTVKIIDNTDNTDTIPDKFYTWRNVLTRSCMYQVLKYWSP